MSFWDGIKKFAQPYGDDDYDEYEDEMNDYPEEQEEEPEAEPVRRRRRSPFASAEPVTPPEASAPVTPPASTGFSGHVMNMATGKNSVVLFHAKTFEDAARAADELRGKKAVIVNMENVDKSLTRRVVDFLSGAVYALDGTVKKVAQSVYLFVPQNMEIVGDLENLKNEADSYI